MAPAPRVEAVTVGASLPPPLLRTFADRGCMPRQPKLPSTPTGYNVPVEGSLFEEAEFFRAIADSGARALLIGRRALIALGIPVLTADYDFWLHIDDIAAFNRAVEPMGLCPTHTPEEARARGRYVAENDERVDVLVARSVPTADGVRVAFEDVWPRRRGLAVAPGVVLPVPATPDLILTKRFGGRPKDLEDIRLLEALGREDGP